MKKLLLLAVLLIGGFVAAETIHNYKCPHDDFSLFFTGKTKVSEAGFLMYQYKCSVYSTHVYWFRA